MVSIKITQLFWKKNLVAQKQTNADRTSIKKKLILVISGVKKV